jgi:hypothetical protein
VQRADYRRRRFGMQMGAPASSPSPKAPLPDNLSRESGEPQPKRSWCCAQVTRRDSNPDGATLGPQGKLRSRTWATATATSARTQPATYAIAFATPPSDATSRTAASTDQG